MKDPIRPCVQEKCPNKKQRTQGLIYRTTAYSTSLGPVWLNVTYNIHAIRPGLSGTVPVFDTFSRRPGNYEIVPEI